QLRVVTDAVREELRPELAVLRGAYRQELLVAGGEREQVQERELGQPLAPVNAGAADQPRGERVVARELPQEAEPGRRQPREIVRRARVEEVGGRLARERGLPQALVALPEGHEQERRRRQTLGLHRRQRPQACAEILAQAAQAAPRRARDEREEAPVQRRDVLVVGGTRPQAVQRRPPVRFSPIRPVTLCSTGNPCLIQ